MRRKLWLISLVLVTVFALGALPVSAAPRRSRARMEARQVIRETERVLAQAERLEHGRRSHELRQAFAEQADANRLFGQGLYQRAINHSLRARRIANRVIEQNRRHRPERREFRRNRVRGRRH